MNIVVHLPRYKMFEYEIQLLWDEVSALLPEAKVSQGASHTLNIFTEYEELEVVAKLKRLAYAERFSSGESEYFTTQYLKEMSCTKTGKSNRQSTRYGAHGLHEYKGKFNPQIVTALLNLSGADYGTKLLDPFCGSGTSLLEANHVGAESLGFDINPLACFIANTKARAMGLDYEDISNAFEQFKMFLDGASSEPGEDSSPRGKYLKDWFLPENLRAIEKLKLAIDQIENNEVRNLFKLVASNLLRDYSEQEPSDLRIRRRKSAYPLKSIEESFEDSIQSVMFNLKQFCQAFPALENKAISRNIDIRDTESTAEYNGTFDIAITSPPYATALPYIDTQRLSLVWLGMVEPKSINTLEKELIGSRDITKKSIQGLRQQLSSEERLPVELVKLCYEMSQSLTEDDGFRRQATPFVIYRYFLNMRRMFRNVKQLLKADGQFALVVGTNSTTLGGRKFELDTPRYLQLIAEHEGWGTEENRELQTYPRYGLHSKNASRGESLLRLKNTAVTR